MSRTSSIFAFNPCLPKGGGYHLHLRIIIRPVKMLNSTIYQIIHTYQNKSCIILSCKFTVCLSIAIFVLYYSRLLLFDNKTWCNHLSWYNMEWKKQRCSIETWSMIHRQLRSSLFLAKRAFFSVGFFFVCWRIYSFVCLFVCLCLFLFCLVFVFLFCFPYLYVCFDFVFVLFCFLFIFVLFCFVLFCFVLFFFFFFAD